MQCPCKWFILANNVLIKICYPRKVRIEINVSKFVSIYIVTLTNYPQNWGIARIQVDIDVSFINYQ